MIVQVWYLQLTVVGVGEVVCVPDVVRCAVALCTKNRTCHLYEGRSCRYSHRLILVCRYRTLRHGQTPVDQVHCGQSLLPSPGRQ